MKQFRNSEYFWENTKNRTNQEYKDFLKLTLYYLNKGYPNHNELALEFVNIK